MAINITSKATGTEGAISINGEERISLDANGNIGIGTSTPSNYPGYTTLTVGGNDNVGGLETVDENGEVRAFLGPVDTNSSYSSLFLYNQSGVRLSQFGSGDDDAFGNYIYGETARPITFWTNTTEKMRITAAGNVGIGTTTPGALLDVYDANFGSTLSNVANFRANRTFMDSGEGVKISFISQGTLGTHDYGAFVFQNDTIQSNGGAAIFEARIGGSSTTGAAGTSPNTFLTAYYRNGGSPYVGLDSITLRTNNTERMRIDSNGNLGINITNPSSYDQYARNLVVGPNASSADAGTSGGISIVGGTASWSSIEFADGTTGDSTYAGGIEYHHAINSLNLWANAYSNSFQVQGTAGSFVATTNAFENGTRYPAYFARAWVNFNGTGTVAIRGSGNVSSITDIGVGDYRVNFTTAMPDANYSVGGMNEALVQIAYNLATSSFRIDTFNSTTGTYSDIAQIFAQVFR